MEKKSKLSILTNGIIKENPTLVLLLGTCPFLATSSSLINALGMGLSATAVLICSNIVISMLRKVIPDKVRIPCYIVVIAGFVTLVQFVLQAYAPDINKALGVFIPLIVVNCIILGRAEAFANKNSVVDLTVSAWVSASHSLSQPWELSENFWEQAASLASLSSRTSRSASSISLRADSSYSEC